MTVGMNTSFLPPVVAMASVQQAPRCAWGCATPMEPFASSAWRCVDCGALAFPEEPKGNAALVDTTIPDAMADVIAMLQGLVERLADYTEDVQLPATTPLVAFQDAIRFEANVRRCLGLLRSKPLESHANAVHATAIEAAARICERRSHSLFHESRDTAASLEATKCAVAVRRLADRAKLLDRPELTAPREAV